MFLAFCVSARQQHLQRDIKKRMSGLKRPHHWLKLFQRRHKFSDCQDYLDYCRLNNVSLRTNTFKGTLYEIATEKFLEKRLHCFNMKRIGGALDLGVDILGKWNLFHYWNDLSTKPTKLKNTKVQNRIAQPLLRHSQEYNNWVSDLTGNNLVNKDLLSLADGVNLLVQCKSYNTKVKPSVIREIAGVYQQLVKKEHEKFPTFMFLISPYPLTKHALHLLNSLNLPLIHCCFSPMKYQSGNIYLIDDWAGGHLNYIYMNYMSRALFEGLQMELQFEKLKQSCKSD